MRRLGSISGSVTLTKSPKIKTLTLSKNSLPYDENQTKKSIMTIANPIYDIVFKYLLED